MFLYKFEGDARLPTGSNWVQDGMERVWLKYWDHMRRESIWLHNRHKEVRIDLHKYIPQRFMFIYSSGECNIGIQNLWGPLGFAGRTCLCPDPVDWSGLCSCGEGLLHSCPGPPARSGSFCVSGRALKAGPTPARSSACGSPTYAWTERRKTALLM